MKNLLEFLIERITERPVVALAVLVSVIFQLTGGAYPVAGWLALAFWFYQRTSRRRLATLDAPARPSASES